MVVQDTAGVVKSELFVWSQIDCASKSEFPTALGCRRQWRALLGPADLFGIFGWSDAMLAHSIRLALWSFWAACGAG